MTFFELFLEVGISSCWHKKTDIVCFGMCVLVKKTISLYYNSSNIYIKDLIFWSVAWSCLQHFWKESPSSVFIKNLKNEIQKCCSENPLMSLNGVLFFLLYYWLFFYIAILKTFVETYAQYFHSNIIFA